MKLEIDLSWKEKQFRAKHVIRFDYRPKNLFAMPDEKVSFLQKLGQRKEEGIAIPFGNENSKNQVSPTTS